MNPFLLKVDGSGRLMWAQYYGQVIKPVGPMLISPEANDGFVMTAIAWNAALEWNDSHSPVLVAKTDATGNLLWNRTYDAVDNTFGIERARDGGYIVFAARSVSLSELTPVLLKISKKGDVEWQKEYAGSKIVDRARMAISGALAPDGGYLFVAANDTGIQAFKTGESGELQWLKTYGHPGTVPLSLSATPDNCYMILAKAMEPPVWLIKIDADGQVLWDKKIDEFKLGSARQTANGQYVITDEDRLYIIDDAGNIVSRWSYADINVTRPPFPGNITAEYGIASVDGGADGGLALAGKYWYSDVSGFDFSSTDYSKIAGSSDASIIKIKENVTNNGTFDRSGRLMVESLGTDSRPQGAIATPGFGLAGIILALSLVLALGKRRSRQ